MATHVRFRFDKAAGEVIDFQIDHDRQRADAEHNLDHDRVAAEIARFVAPHARVIEGLAPPTSVSAPQIDPEETDLEVQTDSSDPQEEAP